MDTDQSKDNKLSVRICNEKPIELIDFTESLMGIGQQYVRFLAHNPDMAELKDIRLYVKEVRPGSTIADLIPLAPYALPVIANANSILAFSSYISTFGNFLLGKGDKPKSIDKTDYEQLNKIAMPISKDSSAQMNISAVINGNVEQNFYFGHVEANAMQNTISRELSALKKPVERLQRKVLLHWYQARNDMKSNKGDRATVESISPYPIKTIFAFDALKHEMLFSAEKNPFHYAYIVDVVVDTIQGKPAMYKIVKFHEKMLKPCDKNDNGQMGLF